jgi:hypothetical protein
VTTRRRQIDDLARWYRWLEVTGYPAAGVAAYWKNWHEFWDDYAG